MSITIICTCERDDVIGTGRALAASLSLELEGADATRDRFEGLLDRFATARFFAYRVAWPPSDPSAVVELTDGRLATPIPQPAAESDVRGAFVSWVHERTTRPYDMSRPVPEEDVAEDELHAGHLLQAAAGWPPPLPARLGVSAILEVAFDPQDTVVIVPILTNPGGDPPAALDATYDKDLDALVVQGQGHLIRTNPVAMTPPRGALELLPGGFLPADGQSPEFARAVELIERRSGAVVAPLAAVIAATPTEHTRETVTWRALSAVAAALDPVHIALTMPARTSGMDGPVLGALLDALEGALDAGARRDLATHVKAAIASLPVFSPDASDPGSRSRYVAAAVSVLGISSEAPVLAQRLAAFAAPAPDTTADEAWAETDATLVRELVPLLDASVSEEGVEAIIERLLAYDPAGGEESAFDRALASRLPQPADQWLRGVTKARRAFTQALKRSFNGAEAVRQAVSLVVEDHLLAAARAPGAIPGETPLERLVAAVRTADFFGVRFEPASGSSSALKELAEALVRPMAPPQGSFRDSLTRAWEAAAETLAPPTGARFVPDLAPRPIPIRLELDDDLSDGDDFDRRFSGVGLLVRTRAANEEPGWAQVNLAFLSYVRGMATPPQARLVAPLRGMAEDGRRRLFIEYDGMPFFLDLFADGAGGDENPFYRIDYPDGVPLPPLAYGHACDAAAFAIGPSGALPPAARADPNDPWAPREVVAAADVPQKAVVTQVYRRTTRVGRMELEENEAGPGPRRIGIPLEGVRALSQDYPRTVLVRGSHTMLFRREDGAGLLADTSVARLAEIVAHGGGAVLVVAFGSAHDAAYDASAPTVRVPLAEGLRAEPLTIAIEQERGRSTARIGDETVALDGSGPYWLRLGVEPAPAGPTGVSITFAASDDRSAPIALLAAPNDALPAYRRLEEAIEATIVCPRVSGADVERWIADRARADEAGLRGDKRLVLRRALVEAAIMRPYVEDVPALLDRVPDPAVTHLLVQLVAIDALDDRGAKHAPVERVIALDRLGDAIPATTGATGASQTAIDILRSLDERARLSSRVECASATEPLDLPPPQNGVLVARVPKGVAAALNVRPLVPADHVAAAGDDLPGAPFHAGLRQHAQGEHTMNGRTYLVFEGLSLVLEAMDAAVEPDDSRIAAALRVVHDRSARSYDLAIARGRDDWWRRVGWIETTTQRWRFDGKPIAVWPIVRADPARACVELAEGAFEREAFVRDEADAVVSVAPLEPSEAGAPVERVTWGEPSAALFRHKARARSRYHGVLSGERPRGTSWQKRVGVLARMPAEPLPRPQLRALLPLTRGLGGGAPPILALLQEPPLAAGGIAGRLLAWIALSPDLPAPDATGLLALRQLRGRDPSRSYVAPDETPLCLDLLDPIGLGFDDPENARIFANSAAILSPVRTDGAGSAEAESFHALVLQRCIDPDWIVQDESAVPRAGEPRWIELAHEGLPEHVPISLDVDGVTLCSLVRSGGEVVATTDASLLETGREGPVVFCRIPHLRAGRLVLLYVPVTGGASITVLSDVDVSDPDGRAPGAFPRAFSAVAIRLVVSSEAVLTLSGRDARMKRVAVSPPTAPAWVRTSPDFERVRVVDADGPNVVRLDEIECAVESGRLALRRRGKGPVRVVPEEWDAPYPLHVQRHVGYLFTRRYATPGREFEAPVTPALRAIGTAPPTSAPPADADAVRLVAFDVPAVVLGCSQHAIPLEYVHGRLDLESIGAVGARLAITVRIVMSSADRGRLRALVLTLDGGRLEVGAAEGSAPPISLHIDYRPAVTPGETSTARWQLMLADGAVVEGSGAIERSADATGVPIALASLSDGRSSLEGWADASVLAIGEDARAAERLDFDWFFGPQPEGVGSMQPSSPAGPTEAQARIVSVSPALAIRN